MNKKYPIFTEKTNCQDCYKCVRYCSVKSIKIENGHAEVIADDCILCGRCVSVCPVGAKVVRSDLKQLKRLLKTDRVILSLAPSFIAQFSSIEPNVLVAKLKELGFYGVSETALGAEQINHKIVTDLDFNKHRVLISSACPVAVDYIKSQLPDYAKHITQVVSPMIAHARMLKKEYGDDVKIAFAGPCIAKKGEADNHSDDIDVAITFAELFDWFNDSKVDLSKQISPEKFIPFKAYDAAIYPIPGGMNQSLELPNVQKLSVTGLEQIHKMLDGFDVSQIDQPIFIEVLACEGGCIVGPGMGDSKPGIIRELAVREYTKKGSSQNLSLDVAESFIGSKNIFIRYSDLDIKQALEQVGKHSSADELNCGGCGYHTCRDFAKALLNGRAENNMCLSYLRTKAQKKANALIKCMPSGVVLLDIKLNIIECNENFAKIFGEDILRCYKAKPGMEGADLNKIVPFCDKFRAFLQSNLEYHQELIRFEGKVFNVSLFSVENKIIIGAIISDITNSEMRRDHIAQQAQKVIDKNLTAVQEIACKLGENMADTEILLRAITDDYGRADYGEVKDASF